MLASREGPISGLRRTFTWQTGRFQGWLRGQGTAGGVAEVKGVRTSAQGGCVGRVGGEAGGRWVWGIELVISRDSRLAKEESFVGEFYERVAEASLTWSGKQPNSNARDETEERTFPT